MMKLAKMVLPQKRRRHYYRPVRTLNPKCGNREKTKVRNSITQKRRQGRLVNQRPDGKPSRRGSQNGRIGRPRTTSLLSPEKQREKRKRQRARRVAKKRAETAARRRAAGLKPYRQRRSAEVVARERAHKAQRTEAIRAARITLMGDGGSGWRFKDERQNHDARYGYGAPKPRQRATAKQVAAGIRFKRTEPVVLDARDVWRMANRRVKSDATRAKHMRGYWRKVHALAK